MLSKLPYVPVYPGDWLRMMRGVSHDAERIYLRLEFSGHDAERYGYLARNGLPIPPADLARMCEWDGTPAQFKSLVDELVNVALLGRTPEGVLYCRRLVELHRKRSEASRNGRRGGNPKLKSPKEKEAGVNPTVNPALTLTSDSEEGEEGRGGAGGKGHGGNGRPMSVTELAALGAAVRRRAKQRKEGE